MMVHFGAFITESSGHLSEYLPYIESGRTTVCAVLPPGLRRRIEFLREQLAAMAREGRQDRLAMLKGEQPMEWNRSWE